MDELTLISETVSNILDRVPPAEEEAEWSPSAWKALEESGLTRVGVPEEIGGSGGDMTQAAAVLHAAGRAAAPVPLAEATLVGGWLLACAAIDLPAGPLSAGVGGTAVPAGGNWVLGGSVQRVPWGGRAEHAAVLAQSPSGPVVALLSPQACRVSPGRNLAGEPRDTLDLSGVRLPGDRVAPVGPDTHEQLRLRGALSRVLLMTGAAEHVLGRCLRYAKERTQFGRPLARFQAVQHHLARIAAETAAMRAASEAAVQAVGADRVGWVPVAAAKVRAGRAAGEIAAIGHQIHGALGITWECGLRRGTTRLWAWRDEFGNEAEWARAIDAWVARAGPDALRLALTDEPELLEVDP